MRKLQPKSSVQRHARLNHRSACGAALVEYAFIMILFLTLLFGIAGFGHALYVYHALNHSAKEGARWASVNGHLCNQDNTCNGANGMNSNEASPTDIENHVLTTLAPSIDSSKATVIAAFTAPSGSPDVCTLTVKDTTGANYGPFANYPGCTVTVRVDYPYDFIFPFIRTTSLNMSSTSEAVISH
jgi:Flp pilus assembly protein TadG